MAATPPFEMGNSVSMMRWPVIIGSVGVIFSAAGRARRTGHFCSMVSSRSPSLVSSMATVSVTVKLPPLIDLRVPSSPGGTMIFWVTAAVSSTVPSTSPPVRKSPSLATGTNSHRASRDSLGRSMPRVMRSPASS